MSQNTIEDLPGKIEYNGRKYYLYYTYGPVFDKKNGEYLYHGHVISYVSIGKIEIQIKHKDLKEAIHQTVSELKRLYEME